MPIHKSGSQDDPNNYRGICISSCLGKFFTLIMNKRLNDFLENNKIINKSQIGFRKNCRTADHLLVLKTLIDVYKMKRKRIFACFVDFRKAYDSVWREGLLFKLITNGCSKRFMRIMLSMYSSVNASVKLHQGITPSFKSSVGVKQGCNLSPTLFNIFINDISDLFDSSCAPVKFGITDMNCLLYADDLVPRQRCAHITSNWLFENNILHQVKEYSYLGISIHFAGNFKQAQKILYNKSLLAYQMDYSEISQILIMYR